jgi:Dolichyl-phosphate-mannose-protein mannosyltransferase
LALLVAIALVAFLIMGYHPGLEDDAFYLAAIKHDLNPALFPHDADFFRVQFQATIFDKLIAFSVRLTHLPVAWAELLWQLLAIFFLLYGCWRIARRCFHDPPARWSAVTLVAALLTVPVAGTGITLADQYLHPRTLATAAILAAVVNVMDGKENARRWWRATIWLSIAFAIHAIMASFGISLCIFLWWMRRRPQKPVPTEHTIAAIVAPLSLAFPLHWIFEPASDAWRQAAATRSFYFVSRWAWYEWLGIFAPIALLYGIRFWLVRRSKQAEAIDAHGASEFRDPRALLSLLSALLYYAVFQTVVGLAIMLPPGLERLRPFEPMRYLHLVYLFFFLIAGGLLGRYVLGRHVYRWALLFIPLAAGMFYAQRQMFPATAHLELPGRAATNPWVEAFAWIRQNTPVDAYFALDPHYVELPGEDYHGFRALAERSVLADAVKDGGMAARVPSLAPRWLREVTAQNGWRDFRAADFDRLRNDFGVTWFVFSRADRQFSDAQPSHFWCLYQDEDENVKVCHLGETTRQPPFRGLDESGASRDH